MERATFNPTLNPRSDEYSEKQLAADDCANCGHSLFSHRDGGMCCKMVNGWPPIICRCDAFMKQDLYSGPLRPAALVKPISQT